MPRDSQSKISIDSIDYVHPNEFKVQSFRFEVQSFRHGPRVNTARVRYNEDHLQEVKKGSGRWAA